MQASLLGQLLVNFGLVSEQQLKEALERQRRKMPRRQLGELLVEEGMLDESALRGILTVQQRKIEAEGKTRAQGDRGSRLLATAGLGEFLNVARELGASDLHLTPGLRPQVRLNGALRELPCEPLDEARCTKLALSALSQEERERFAKASSIDAALADPQAGRFRVHLFRHAAGIGAVLRAIPDAAWEFEKLGLPPQIAQVCRQDQGLVLVTGTIGSGKSTTLAALLQLINRSRRVHVVTIEDPVEVVHRSDSALFSQREVGVHAKDWASALRAALREDPDVIVVGELRDLETATIALSAAETGHLVLATMHTSSADRTIHRFVDQFPGHQRDHARAVLANVLRCIVCQQLVPTADGKGLALACEVLNVNAAVANLIREERMHQIPATMQTGRKDGMCMMDDSLAALAKAKRIALDEALARAVDPERFMRPVGAT